MSYEQFCRDSINSTLARQAYANYLGTLSWDYFLTVTFRKPFRDSIKAHETVWETLQPLNTVRAFLATERHRYPNNDCHVHGLIKIDPFSERGYRLVGGAPLVIWGDCFRVHGRSRVEEIRSAEDVSAYCAKYVSKRMSDYGFYGQPQFWQT